MTREELRVWAARTEAEVVRALDILHRIDEDAEQRVPVDRQCVFCWNPYRWVAGEIGGVRLCAQHLAYAHDRFDMPIRIYDQRIAQRWREAKYEVIDDRRYIDSGYSGG